MGFHIGRRFFPWTALLHNLLPHRSGVFGRQRLTSRDAIFCPIGTSIKVMFF